MKHFIISDQGFKGRTSVDTYVCFYTWRWMFKSLWKSIYAKMWSFPVHSAAWWAIPMLCCHLGNLEGFTTEFCWIRSSHCFYGLAKLRTAFEKAITDPHWLPCVAERNKNIYLLAKHIFFIFFLKYLLWQNALVISEWWLKKVAFFLWMENEDGERTAEKMPECALLARIWFI